ncbi:NigD1/NigD2 family lipoprotein [Carboxylicivirga linearis]|uniref:NigD-like C-terminal domain-containing protein n=1 Tax=Carboxylicivirga linearis TaxID=1628157 RepID=A0ABS5JSJ2_9BACT|nr:NigD-like C-terminal domain-containing protein [Carboxylicivirga linearis]MBS2097524.1 hypothetical protein [Carboxylicivirga linearis]
MIKTRNWVLALVASLLLVVTGCMKEYETVPYTYRQLCVTATYGDFYMFISDSGAKFITEKLPADYEFEVDQRVMISFTEFTKSEVEDYDYIFEPLTVSEIASLDIIFINDENKDTLGNDGVILNNAYVSGNYLNVDLSFGASGTVVHHFNTSYDEELQFSSDTLTLTFHHKDNDDLWLQTFSGFLSFDLRSLEENRPMRPYVLNLISTKTNGEESSVNIDVEY